MATGARTSVGQQTQSNNHSSISDLLDNLLRGYDNSIRPDFGGPPATVEVDIMVRSMGPISEVDMVSHFSIYLAAYEAITILMYLNKGIDQVTQNFAYNE